MSWLRPIAYTSNPRKVPALKRRLAILQNRRNLQPLFGYSHVSVKSLIRYFLFLLRRATPPICRRDRQPRRRARLFMARRLFRHCFWQSDGVLGSPWFSEFL